VFKKTKKVWFRLFKKIRAFKKNLLGLIIRVKKTKEGLVQTFQKNRSVQKNLLGLIINGLIIHVKKTKKVWLRLLKKISAFKKPSWFDNQWFDNSRKKNQEGLVQT
jgi:hypothetical protein